MTRYASSPYDRAKSQTLVSGHPIDSPRWSPSGYVIAYLAKAKGTMQIFVVGSHGGTPRQVTHAKNDVEQFAWSPDGNRIAYVMEDEPSNPKAAQRGENLFDVHDDGYLTSSRPRAVASVADLGEWRCRSAADRGDVERDGMGAPVCRFGHRSVVVAQW